MTQGMALRLQDSEMLEEYIYIELSLVPTLTIKRINLCVPVYMWWVLIIINSCKQFPMCLLPICSFTQHKRIYFILTFLTPLYFGLSVCIVCLCSCAHSLEVHVTFLYVVLSTYLFAPSDCVWVCDCKWLCLSVYALSTPWHVWLPSFRPGQPMTRQGNQDPVSGWMRL